MPGTAAPVAAVCWAGENRVMERPSLPLTAVYDGQCEICQAAVSWIRMLDRRGAMRSVALQDVSLADVHPELAFAARLPRSHRPVPSALIHALSQPSPALHHLHPLS